MASTLGVLWVVLALAQPVAPASPDASATSKTKAPQSGRVLVVADVDAARLEALYGGLRGAGLVEVGLEERVGVDRPAEEPLPPPLKDAARAQLLVAKGHLRELELEAAQAAVDDAVATLLRLDDPAEAQGALADALLLRAEVALLNERADSAALDLRLLARLQPQRATLEPALYPPSLVDAYARARADNAAASASASGGVLSVIPRSAVDAPVLITVDGAAYSAPARVDAGPHLVTARASGAVTRAVIVTLDDAPLVLEPLLEPSGAAAERAARVRALQKNPRASDLEALAVLCAAGAVVVVRGDTVAVYARGGALEPVAIAASADAAAVGRAVAVALQTPAASLLARGRAGPPEPADDGIGVWTIVSVVGGVVLVSAAAVTLWALWPAEEPPTTPKPLPAGCCSDFP